VVEGTDPILKKEFIVCSAHYDHVGVGKPDASGDSIYNGARDNAIGVMSVLLAAENISKHPLKRSVIFILFTGEEKGLLGSKWFVQESPVDLNNIVFCLNTDGGGYNDTTITTVIGKRRVDADQIFDKACEAAGLEVFDGTDDTQFLFNNSDNIMFSQKGIPSVTFSAGFRGMNEEIIKHYHQPSDEVETLNFNYVLKFAKSFGFALREIGDSDKRIFWKKEDEFYKTGKKLYQ
jgi:Zn-dependent M28 family amino/carboxypeptidase